MVEACGGASRRTVLADAKPRDNEVLAQIDRPVAAIVESVERLLVGRALDRSRGNLGQAANRLGITRKGLFLKRKHPGLEGR